MDNYKTYYVGESENDLENIFIDLYSQSLSTKIANQFIKRIKTSINKNLSAIPFGFPQYNDEGMRKYVCIKSVLVYYMVDEKKKQ